MGLALDEPNDNENSTQVNGIDVLIADQVRPFVEGNKIDYINSVQGEGFIISSGRSCC